MRRMNLTEGRGSGVDKVITQIELFQLPAPYFRETEHSTIVTLFAEKKFPEMDNEERARACYQHACIQWILGEKMTNASLRKRFGVSDKNHSAVSRVITNCLNKNLIKSKEESNRKKVLHSLLV